MRLHKMSLIIALSVATLPGCVKKEKQAPAPGATTTSIDQIPKAKDLRLPALAVANAADLPKCGNPNRNIVVHEFETSLFWACNGSDWVNITTLMRGLQGDRGPQGATGTQGPVGPEGLPGHVVRTASDTTHCGASGGVLIQVGADRNRNGEFDDNDALMSEHWICNGAAGAKGDTGAHGETGPKGDSGATGPQGPAGKAADQYVVTTGHLAPDPEVCEAGGIEIVVYMDANDNHTLDSGEKSTTRQICNGRSGAPAIITSEQSAVCPSGGTRFVHFTDVDLDGIFSSKDTNYGSADICNGAPGQQGYSAIVDTRFAEATECAAGGVVLTTCTAASTERICSQNNATYRKSIICNGAEGKAGANAVLTRTPLDPGDPHCPNGGIAFESFVDTTPNGVRDASEPVSGPSYLCNGSNGADGMITITKNLPAGDSCSAGGLQVETFADLDDDRTFDPNEPGQRSTVCNGIKGDTGTTGTAGTSMGVDIQQLDGNECARGGVNIRTFRDFDSDGNLDAGEQIIDTKAVCNGTQGEKGETGATGAAIALHATPFDAETDKQAECENGGVKIETFKDDDRDGAWDNDEVILSTAPVFICAGVNGASGANGMNSVVVAVPEPAGENCTAGGTKYEMYLDLDGSLSHSSGDKQLAVNYVCNGSTGEPGTSPAVSVSNLPYGSTTCPSGGVQLIVGGEVKGTVCSGVRTVVSFTPIAAGDAACPGGGDLYMSFSDMNGNGLYDSGDLDRMVKLLCSSVKWVQVAAGSKHTCALSFEGRMMCWGDNASGQMGTGSSTPSTFWNATTPQGHHADVVRIAAGSYRTYAVMRSGALRYWGTPPPFDTVKTPTEAVSSGVKDVAASNDIGCYVLTSGIIKCWGGRFFGQIDSATTIVGVTDPSAVTVGTDFACALNTNGTVQCWGASGSWLGIGGALPPNAHTAMTVPGLSDVATIAAGAHQVCATTKQGSVKCWGEVRYSQIPGSTQPESLPVDVTAATGSARNVIMSGMAACVQLFTGGVRCWGSNQQGQVGIGSSETGAIPPSDLALPETFRFSTSSGAAHHICGITNTNILCWGFNAFAQVGNGSQTAVSSPFPVMAIP